VTNNIHIHIPTPGDHYSPATGSAIMTIIYQFAHHHSRRGGQTQIIVGRNTRHDYPVGQCVEVDFNLTQPPKWQKDLDVAASRLGLPRCFGQSRYLPGVHAIDPDFTGPVFFHNNPVAIPVAKKLRPNAKHCLWANNLLFRTYDKRETGRVASTAHRLICCSDFIANDLRNTIGDNEKIRVVRNGADPNQFSPDPNKTPNPVPRLLFVGRIQPVKGPDLLIRAAAKIASSRKFTLRIVGSSGFNANDPLTPYEHELRRLAKPLGDRVEFLPFTNREKVVDEFRAADVFVVPSNWDDPCPLTVAEGMACGLATIASKRGGIPEMGADSVLYFNPPDFDSLADHLSRLIDDPGLRRDWGSRARARALDLSWENQYNALLAALS